MPPPDGLSCPITCPSGSDSCPPNPTLTSLPGSKIENKTVHAYVSRQDLIDAAVSSSHVLPPVNQACAAFFRGMNIIDGIYSDACVLLGKTLLGGGISFSIPQKALLIFRDSRPFSPGCRCCPAPCPACASPRSPLSCGAPSRISAPSPQGFTLQEKAASTCPGASPPPTFTRASRPQAESTGTSRWGRSTSAPLFQAPPPPFSSLSRTR